MYWIQLHHSHQDLTSESIPVSTLASNIKIDVDLAVEGLSSVTDLGNVLKILH